MRKGFHVKQKVFQGLCIRDANQLVVISHLEPKKCDKSPGGR